MCKFNLTVMATVIPLIRKCKLLVNSNYIKHIIRAQLSLTFPLNMLQQLYICTYSVNKVYLPDPLIIHNHR